MKLRDKASAGVPVVAGPPGKDAYELAITRGYFSGTLEQWIESLKGARGDKGDRGIDGINGKDGAQGPRGPAGPKGDRGPPPEHEWRGTELRFMHPDGEWGSFVDLKGEKGDKGTPGSGGGAVLVTGNSYMPVGF